MKVLPVIAVCLCFVVCALGYLPRCNYKCCIKDCKSKYYHYWQRFCHGSRIKVWCYDHEYLYIHKAQYGSMPCNPSNDRFYGYPTCGPGDAATLQHVRQYCNYKTTCYGWASVNLMDGNPTPFPYTCPYASDNAYIEYYCKPKQSFCEAFCRCKEVHNDDAHCTANYAVY